MQKFHYPLAIILGLFCLLESAMAAEPSPAKPPQDAARIRQFDRNQDRQLSFEEFEEFASRIPRLKGRPEAVAFLFELHDADGSGQLDRKELQELRSSAQQSASPAGRSRSFGPDTSVRRNPLRLTIPKNKKQGKTNQQKPKSTKQKAKQPTIKAAEVEAERMSQAEQPPVKLTEQQLAFFESKIRPVLADRCYGCHSSEAKQLRAGLMLDSRDAILLGGSSGPAVVVSSEDGVVHGDAEASPLIQALRGDYYDQMPPSGKLSSQTIADFERWVAMGAPDPREGEPVPVEETPESTIDIEAGKQHWAFQLPEGVKPPSVADKSWPSTDIDRFLLAKMEVAGLKPVGDASRGALLRRVSFDLTGLPPSVEEIEAFLSDPDSTPIAFEKVVDRLLDSPAFGERWGRHWLDVARYGESSGREANIFYPFAWRYRDYVIDAFNADKPFDEFLREQIAGDLLPASNNTEKAEQTIATGFLALGAKSHSERDPRQYVLDVADEQLDAVSRGMLGLTVACARCHDHKFDPIPQTDYYALAGILASTETLSGGVRGRQVRQANGLVELPESVEAATGEPLSPKEIDQLYDQLDNLDQAIQRVGNGPDARRMRIGIEMRQANVRQKISYYHEDGSPRDFAMGVRDGDVLDIPLFVRGELKRPSDVVPRGFLQVLQQSSDPEISTGSGRRELAEWIASERNPLTARVMANRVWLHLFGRGLVTTPDNFGATGEPPSHPELLDHLAIEFVESGWSVKELVRQIVLSRAYQLDSTMSFEGHEIDPDNEFVWRHPARRLEAEAIRDAILSASGTIDLQRPVGSFVAKIGDGQVRALDNAAVQRAKQLQRAKAMARRTGNNRMQRNRNAMFPVPEAEPTPTYRAVYLPIIRDRLDESLAAFDFPDPSLVAGQRETTTVPSQSLFLMNSELVIEQAVAMAERLAEVSSSTSERIDLAFQWTLSRSPRADESRAARTFLKEFSRIDQDKQGNKNKQGNQTSAWSAFCQSLFATAEFREIP
ncbi:DUF1553 domain-containing protein [Adhaeretor mobilis]|uniref:Planctomycete cytochrome C n=1 Tax=Adhaeretor mobilis TaxID=1930276 RepID=A0A517MS07_9BACT|nr:DUF1553 domain-containing protein [Adhaeretor mobilis]QDS97654.1 Planctomycete cytochrome C [Adhaeretor mobilis]